jgi:hypothetical protein
MRVNPYGLRTERAVGAGNATIIDDPRDSAVFADYEKPRDQYDALVAWVNNHVSQWREHRAANFELAWDAFERQWRGIYDVADKKKKNERSTVISPALSEAVENCVSEIEEAVFGRGDFFDFGAEKSDDEIEKAALERNRIALKEDLAASDYVLDLSECVMNAAIFGTGIAEVLVEKKMIREITSAIDEITGQPVPSVRTVERLSAPIKPIHPRNFLIDPNARKIDDALGCAIEEYVGSHVIVKGQKDGTYRDVEIGTDAGDQELLPNKQAENEYAHDKTKILRYYGLVPRHLLSPKPQAEEPVALFDSGEEEAPSEDVTDADMVEAIVVIANGSTCIKATENPFLMQDRPVVAMQWDIVPGSFWGRGVCEKGFSSASLLDTELRSRADALAFTSAPLMAMDATRLPRGFKLEVYPGKSLLTNGSPREILNPMRFGEIDQNTWQQAGTLDQMVQRATGSLDSIAMAQRGAGGDARSGAVSMSLAGIVKRHKRTLMRFVDGLLIPSLRKILWRQMQYNAPRYVPINPTFTATSTMGIMQREYETMNLVQLLNTMDPKSLEYKAILIGVVQNSGLVNREALIEMIKKAAERDQQLQEQAMQAQAAANQQPVDPVAQEMAAVDAQLTLAKKRLELFELQAKIEETIANTKLKDAQAQQTAGENAITALRMATKGLYALETEAEQQRMFEERMKAADIAMEKARLEEKARDRVSNENITKAQISATLQAAMRPAKLNIVTGPDGMPSGVVPEYNDATPPLAGV